MKLLPLNKRCKRNITGCYRFWITLAMGISRTLQSSLGKGDT